MPCSLSNMYDSSALQGAARRRGCWGRLQAPSDSTVHLAQDTAIPGYYHKTLNNVIECPASSSARVRAEDGSTRKCGVFPQQHYTKTDDGLNITQIDRSMCQGTVQVQQSFPETVGHKTMTCEQDRFGQPQGVKITCTDMSTACTQRHA